MIITFQTFSKIQNINKRQTKKKKANYKPEKDFVTCKVNILSIELSHGVKTQETHRLTQITVFILLLTKCSENPETRHKDLGSTPSTTKTKTKSTVRYCFLKPGKMVWARLGGTAWWLSIGVPG